MEQSTPTPASTPTDSGSGSSSAAVTTNTIGDARASLLAADSSSATPATTTPPVDTTHAAATAQPTDEGTPQIESAATGKGEPPKWRWQDILANARETSAKEAEARVRQELETQYSGVREFASLSAEERAGLRTWHQALNGDATARALVAQAQPQLAVSLGWSQAPAADPEPEADLQTPDGTPVYSAPQLAKREAWLRRQIIAEARGEFSKELAPLQTVAQSFRHQQHQAQAWTDVAKALEPIKGDPDFEAHKTHFNKVFDTDPKLAQLLERDPGLAVEIAWGRVYREHVLPAKAKTSEQQVVANLQQRAVAGVTNPASATPATPAKTIGNARAALEYANSVMGGA